MLNIKNIALYILLLMAVSIMAQAQTKSDLKILIVAHNPDSVFKGGHGSPVSARYAQLARSRGQEYKTLLNNYFHTVKVVNSDAYNATMSDHYDVTIMDELPKPLKQVDLGMYRKGESIMRGNTPMMYNRYLPEDFDRAIIMTSLITDDMTYCIPSKFLTQCHCLNAHAFNIKNEHDIFNKPFKVNLSYEERPTPRGVKKFYSGVNFPNEMKMWRVQTESPQDGKGYMIGQIMVGMGFEDSPDCEYICGGESLKDITGMAMGRSGNIFHWGFSASPNFMTETAKKVFVNTIHYMAQFNGNAPLVKMNKYNSRNWVDEFCYRETHQLLDVENEYKPTGDKTIDSIYLYYKNNYSYFYYNGSDFRPQIDEDAKALGIANNDIRLLEKCVSLLEKDKMTEKAFTLLKRYTEYNFTTAKAWREWLDTYKDYLFFTETGGYKFMIDTWNNPKLSQSLKKESPKPSTSKVDATIPLTFKGNLEHNKGNEYTLRLEVNIKEGWHAYATLTPETNYFIPTTITITLPKGMKEGGKLITPKTYPYEDAEGVWVYKGKSIFTQQVMIDKNASKEAPIKAVINYQICNEYMCMPPDKKELIINLNR